jgi:GT2 family glycosyltransferase
MLHILLPVYNRREITRQFIRSLKEQSYKDYHLIVINDGSSDGTSEMIKDELHDATIIRGNGNLWWAGSLQKGYHWLKKNANIDDMVLILNNDVIISDEFLTTGLELISKNEKSLIYTLCYSIQSKELFWSGIHVDWKNYSFKPNVEREFVNCVSTRGLFLKVKDFLVIGGFHPILLPHYSSDYEFTYRAFKKGYNFVVDAKLSLIMDESSSGFRSFESDSFLTFINKYFSRKNPSNPFYQFMFIALSCPWKYKLKNWLKIYKRAFSIIYNKLFNKK